MGKFNYQRIKKKKKSLEKRKEEDIKFSLKNKELIEVIPKNSPTPTDGILLFGNHRDKKISELLAGFDTAGYVLSYLSQNKNLPLKFRRTIKMILENQDPFEVQESLGKFEGLNVREVFRDEDGNEDDIPW